LRLSDDIVEQEGVRRAEAAAEQADAIIFVADATRPETWQTSRAANIFLMNKTDLDDLNQSYSRFPPHFTPVSIKQGQGLDKIADSLAKQLGDMNLAEEGLLVTRERHRMLLIDTVSHLRRGLPMLQSEDQLELTAMEWRSAWSLLGGILGIGDIEHILDRVFSEFCIGK